MIEEDTKKVGKIEKGDLIIARFYTVETKKIFTLSFIKVKKSFNPQRLIDKGDDKFFFNGGEELLFQIVQMLEGLFEMKLEKLDQADTFISFEFVSK
jgi:hypothetical protein